MGSIPSETVVSILKYELFVIDMEVDIIPKRATLSKASRSNPEIRGITFQNKERLHFLITEESRLLRVANALNVEDRLERQYSLADLIYGDPLNDFRF
jgi:hypothetical protein